MHPLVKQIQLPLHRQFRVRELPLRLFLCLSAISHFALTSRKTNKVHTSLVAFKSIDKQSANICQKNSQVAGNQLIV